MITQALSEGVLINRNLLFEQACKHESLIERKAPANL